MTKSTESLACFELELDGGRERLRFRVPTAGEVIALVIPPDLRTRELAERRLCLELEALIDTIDGEFPTAAQVLAIVRDPELLAQVLQRRNAFYNHLAALGRARALCPVCAKGAAELDLTFYWLALRLPPWRFADRGVLFHLPSLASRLPTGTRPREPRCARGLRFAYPAEPPIDGSLASLQTAEAATREREAWADFVPHDPAALPDERAHWRRDNPGFVAMLRLGVAIGAAPGEMDELPLGAYLFLDLLHFATNNVDIDEPSRVQVRCGDCGAAFLPVLEAR